VIVDFLSVASKHEAMELLGRFGDQSALMAGGTSMMGRIARGRQNSAAIISIAPIKDLRRIDAAAGNIGALVTLRQLATSSSLARYDSLRVAAASCGGWQTQNVGTVGGNMCNASPASDLLPPLFVHGARVNLESAQGGKRTLALDAFISGPERIDRRPDELLVSVDVDPMPDNAVDMTVKIGHRGAMEIAAVSLAVRLALREDGRTIDDLRIAVGAVAPTAFRATEAESILVGQLVCDDAIREASQAILRRAAPVASLRASASYRLAILPRVFDRALRQSAERASAGLHLSTEASG
jgi:carbon-monoxide dehydrogenase medium subunit